MIILEYLGLAVQACHFYFIGYPPQYPLLTSYGYFWILLTYQGEEIGLTFEAGIERVYPPTPKYYSD